MADQMPFMNKTDGCIPFEFFLDFLDFVKRNEDLIEVITYDDLAWGDDWDHENHYPAEWERWKDRVRTKELDPTKIYLLIQHDVDSHPDRNMAAFRAEQEKGIRSNIMIFNERVDRQLLAQEGKVRIKHYDLDIPLLKDLEREGFVIGYHCNAVEKANFDLDRAQIIFAEDLTALRETFDIRYFSPHGGVRGSDGWSNAAVEMPEMFRGNLRWVHNRRTARMHGNYSDGGINGKRIAAEERDPRAFVRKWLPGRRYRMLFHPQYYHTPFSETQGLATAEWYNEVIRTYRAAASNANAWPDELLEAARTVLQVAEAEAVDNVGARLDPQVSESAAVVDTELTCAESEDESAADDQAIQQERGKTLYSTLRRIFRFRRSDSSVEPSLTEADRNEPPKQYRINQPTLHSNEGREEARRGPIIIGGDGRSGTTLLSVILDSHPELSVGPELHFNGKRIPNLGPAVLEALEELEKLAGGSQAPLFEKRPEMKPTVQYVNRILRAGIDNTTLRQITQDVMRRRGNDLDSFEDRCALVRALGEHNAHTDGKMRWGFKIMREIRNLDKYASTWPDATYIHIIRDGRDVAASQISEHGSWGYDDIAKAASGWRSVIESARATARSVRYVEVRYEDIVLRPETTIRELLEFLHVPWDVAVLEHAAHGHSLFDSSVRHPSKDQVAQPINDSALGRYIRDLSSEQIASFEDVAADTLKDLGYVITDSKK